MADNSSVLPDGSAVRTAIRHGLFWLLVANGVGVLLALFLVVPPAGALFGEWTYGRWMPLHLNLHLFGWTSLPLVAWLLGIYAIDERGLTRWGNAAVWAWSAALLGGAVAWLHGGTSGKIFLDWSGRSLALFGAALVFLWLVLVRGWLRSGRGWARLAGLLALATVPPLLAYTCQRSVYPPVNPESGGPTGASLLGSTLTVVFLLLLLPPSLRRNRKETSGRALPYWLLLALQAAAVPFLEKAQASHHEPGQWIGLGLLLVWIPALPLYFRRYPWSPSERRWLHTFLGWLAVLIFSGWLSFLPGILESTKFSHTLVAHSHLAMAGFTSTFLVFLSVVLLGGNSLFDSARWWWNAATGAYVVLMFWAGLLEAADPDWVLRAGAARSFIFSLRLACGLVLLAVAAWWWWSLARPREAAVKGGAA